MRTLKIAAAILCYPIRHTAGAVAAFFLVGCGGGGGAPTIPPVDVDLTAQGTWRTCAPLPAPRQEMPAALLGGRVYTPGGLDAQNNASAAVDVYDPATDTWAAAPPLPEGRHHAGIAAANGRLYVLGGYRPGGPAPGSASDTVFEFDPARGSWSQKAPMPAPRAAHVAVTFGGKIFCIGGVQSGDAALGVNAVYDPTADRWAALAPMPTPREHLAAAVVGSQILVVGGRTGAGNNRELEAYNPAANTWESLPPLPTARSGLAAAELRGRLYVFDGEIPGVFAQNEQYDPASRSWRTLAPMPTPRHGMGAVTVGGTIFVIGGGTVAGLAPANTNEALTIP